MFSDHLPPPESRPPAVPPVGPRPPVPGVSAPRGPDVGRLADAGMTTAEYAVGTVAACAFAGVLFKIVTSPQVLALVRGVIERALQVSF